MADQSKNIQGLTAENAALKTRIKELEAAERKCTRAEETSRKSDPLVHAISESAQDAILMMDVEGRISY